MHELQRKTVDEVIADLRREGERQSAVALILVKAVRASGPSTAIDPAKLNPRRGIISKGLGAIAKFSPSGEFVGWYREGQTRGRPSSRMPIERELDEANERYFQMLRQSVPRKATNAILSARSARGRKGAGLVAQICDRYQELTQLCVPRCQRVHKIATPLKCNPDYVRRVLRDSGIRSGPPRSK